MQKLLFLFALFMYTLSTVFAQEIVEPMYQYPYQIFSTKKGLSHSQVHKSFKDSRGFVWVATKEGVDRFDGLEFINFRTDSIFIEDFVSDIKEDQNGHVWFSGRKGAYKYDGQQFEFYKWDFQYSAPYIIIEKDGIGFKSLKSNDTYYYYGDGKFEQIFFYQEPVNEERNYATIFQPFIGETAFIISSKEMENNSIRELHAVKNGEAKLLARDSLIRSIPALGSNTDKIYFQVGQNIQNYIKDSLIQMAATPAQQSARWFHYNDKLGYRNNSTLFLQNDNGKFERILQTSFSFSQLSTASNGIYVSTERGLIHLFIDHPISIYSLEKGMIPSVWGILEDAEENMWFSSYSEQKIIKQSDSGYQEIDFNRDPKYRFYPGSLKTNSGELWFSAGGAMVIIDKDGKYSSQASPIINFLFEKDEKVYGAGEGLYLFQNHDIIRHYSNDDGLDMDRLGYLETIASDTSGLFWFGSHLGLATWDGIVFKNYYIDQDIPSGLVSIKKDHRDNLWFGTKKGISFFDYSNTLPRSIAPDEFNKSITFIEFIDSSYVVFGGSNELYLLDLPAFYQGEFDLYSLNQENGFLIEECLQNSSYKDSKGHIWIGTSAGVVKLDPQKIKLYKAPSEPHFSYFSYFKSSEDQEVLNRIPFGQKDFSFTATSSDRNFEIKFFTINHHKPKSITYRHRLKGYEENWSLPRSPRFVSYSDLPPGQYEFELQACLGEKCSQTKALKIHIKPSLWYEYHWAKACFAILLTFVVFLLYWQRQQNKDAKKQTEHLEKEKVESELRQLKMRKNLAVHKINPHFTFNVLNAISDLVRRQETELALTYTAKFANLFRSLLANEGELFRTLQMELQFIEDYLKLEKLRFPNKFSYLITVDETVKKKTYVPTMVIQSFVNNAIKHGIEPLKKDGLIEVKVNQTKNIISVVITDNGIGRKESERLTGKYKTGEGIKIANEIFNYLNEFYPEVSSVLIEDLHPNDRLYKGTKVSIQLYTNYPEKIY